MQATVSTSGPLALVTGASSGIGQALALELSRRGYKLALVARRVDLIESWAQAVGLNPQRYKVYEADLANMDEAVEAGNKCLEELGIPDLVIANAGISIGMDTMDYEDLKVMAATFAINTVGMAATFHPFLQAMVTRGSGTLVGIGSVAGIRGLPGHGAYCASKAAVISYCESLRGELRGTGVDVVTLCPGYVDTPLTRQNRYSMPFLMSPQRFAHKAMQAITAKKTYTVIPWQMHWVAIVLRALPNAWFDRLMHGRPRKHRRPDSAI